VRSLLRIGIVGLGTRGLAAARVLDELPETQIRWLCDHSAEVRMRLRARFPNANPTSEVEDLLADESIDAIVVATPPPVRYEICRAAVEGDKHVLVGSPFARRGEQARELVRLAERRGRCLVLSDPLVFHPGVQRLKQLLDGRRLGRLYHVSAERHEPGLSSASRDRDPLWSLGAETLAAVVHLIGDEPIEAAARAESHLRPPTPDVIVAGLRFATGISVHVRLSSLHPVPASRLTVVGAKRTVEVDTLAPEYPLAIYDRASGPDGEDGEETGVSGGRMTSPALHPRDPLLEACRRFVESAREGFDALSTARSGAIAVSVVEALERSVDGEDEAPAEAVPDELPHSSEVVQLPLAPR
jgi:predicted dehydrogenase